MSNVSRIRHTLLVGNEIKQATTELDYALVNAIDAAKAAGLPQGMIVSLLHAHAHAETHKMVSE